MNQVITTARGSTGGKEERKKGGKEMKGGSEEKTPHEDYCKHRETHLTGQMVKCCKVKQCRWRAYHGKYKDEDHLCQLAPNCRIHLWLYGFFLSTDSDCAFLSFWFWQRGRVGVELLWPSKSQYAWCRGTCRKLPEKPLCSLKQVETFQKAQDKSMHQ